MYIFDGKNSKFFRRTEKISVFSVYNLKTVFPNQNERFKFDLPSVPQSAVFQVSSGTAYAKNPSNVLQPKCRNSQVWVHIESLWLLLYISKRSQQASLNLHQRKNRSRTRGRTRTIWKRIERSANPISNRIIRKTVGNLATSLRGKSPISGRVVWEAVGDFASHWTTPVVTKPGPIYGVTNETV